MAFFDSKTSTFEIDDTGGTIRDLSAYVNDINGLPGPRNLNEVTALGDSGAKFIPGLENVTISLSGSYSDDAQAPDVVLGTLRTHTSAVDFEYGPEGNSTGDIMYTGTCWVTSYEVQSRVGSAVAWSATLQVEGTVTRGAHS